jgi:hypothetical protein
MSKPQRITTLKEGDIFVDGTGEHYYVYISGTTAFDLQNNFVDDTFHKSVKVRKVKAKIVVVRTDDAAI